MWIGGGLERGVRVEWPIVRTTGASSSFGALAFMRPTVFFIRGALHCLLLIFLIADPLCMARWWVVSLLIDYCGSSFEARTL